MRACQASGEDVFVFPMQLSPLPCVLLLPGRPFRPPRGQGGQLGVLVLRQVCHCCFGTMRPLASTPSIDSRCGCTAAGAAT